MVRERKMRNFITLFGLSLFLGACGASTSGNSNTSFSTDAKTTICSVAKTLQGTQTARLRTVGSSQLANYYSTVQLRLENMPSDFINNDGYVRFYEMTFTSSGIQALGNSPLTFEIVNPSYPSFPIAYNLTEITYDELYSYGINNTVIVVTLSGYSSHLLDINYFTESGAEVSRSYGLIPPYYVDPNQYEASKANLGSSVVKDVVQFHPFDDSRNLEEEDYLDLMDSLCLSGGLQSM